MKQTILLLLIFSVGCELCDWRDMSAADKRRDCESTNDPRRKWLPRSSEHPTGACGVRTFLDYCLDPATSQEMQHTISIIKSQYVDQDCSKVWEAVRFTEEINLDNQGISDITPLAGMSKLKKVSLRFNDIKDVWILSTMSYLEEMLLDGNPVQAMTQEERNCNGYPDFFPWDGPEGPTQIYIDYCGTPVKYSLPL